MQQDTREKRWRTWCKPRRNKTRHMVAGEMEQETIEGDKEHGMTRDEG